MLLPVLKINPALSIDLKSKYFVRKMRIFGFIVHIYSFYNRLDARLTNTRRSSRAGSKCILKCIYIGQSIYIYIYAFCYFTHSETTSISSFDIFLTFFSKDFRAV